MKTYAVSLSLLTATLFAAIALAQSSAPAPTPPPAPGVAHPFREKILRHFDANHDGRLDATERAAARQAWQDFLQQHPMIKPAPPAAVK